MGSEILGPFIPRLFCAPAGLSPKRPVLGGIRLADWLAVRLSPASGVELDVGLSASSPSELLRSTKLLPWCLVSLYSWNWWPCLNGRGGDS